MCRAVVFMPRSNVGGDAELVEALAFRKAERSTGRGYDIVLGTVPRQRPAHAGIV